MSEERCPSRKSGHPNAHLRSTDCGCSGQLLQYLFLRSYFLQHLDLAFFCFERPQLPEQSVLHCWAAISTSGIEELNTLSI